MRDCVLVVNDGRNLQGILKDAQDYLAGVGYRASQLVVTRMDRDLGLPLHLVGMPAHVHVWAVERTVGSEVTAPGLPVVFVLNGGTTRQQWRMARHFFQEEIDDLLAEGQGQTARALPCLALDVQRDGALVLDEHKWAW